MKSKINRSKKLEGYIKKLPRARYFKEEKISYHSFLNDKLLVTQAVRQGVTVDLFEEIKTNSPFDDQQWSDFLHINLRTLQRYKKDEGHVFKSFQSEKIFELAEVIHTGYEVFDTPEDFYLWLNCPSPVLANEKPIDLLDSSYGKDLVLAELNRIEYGVFV